MADVNLRYTSIVSPIDGVVIERSVDIGQTVAASFQAPLLFLIANDLTKMQVIAQIDEADIGAMSEKAKVDFSVDAFPGQTFRGEIAEIRLTSKLPSSSTSTGSSEARRRWWHRVKRRGLQRDDRCRQSSAQAAPRNDRERELHGREHRQCLESRQLGPALSPFGQEPGGDPETADFAFRRSFR